MMVVVRVMVAVLLPFTPYESHFGQRALKRRELSFGKERGKLRWWRCEVARAININKKKVKNGNFLARRIRICWMLDEVGSTLWVNSFYIYFVLKKKKRIE